jgi:hypothetical protein
MGHWRRGIGFWERQSLFHRGKTSHIWFAVEQFLAFPGARHLSLPIDELQPDELPPLLIGDSHPPHDRDVFADVDGVADSQPRHFPHFFIVLLPLFQLRYNARICAR